MTEAGFNDRIAALIDALEYRVCTTEAEYDAVGRLRYDAYLAEGAIPPNPHRRLGDAHDTAANALVFAIHLDGALAASIRLHRACARHPVSPALAAFPEHLGAVLAARRAFIDPSRFVTDARAAAAHPGLHLGVLRLAFIAADYAGAQMVTATVRQEHQAFYRRVLNCTPVCPPRPYPGLLKPLGLMTVDYGEQAPRVLARYPFFAPRPGPERALFAGLAALAPPA